MPFWESPVFWGIIGILGVFIGILATAFLSNRKVLEYYERISPLITKEISDIPDLTVMMGGLVIEDLTATEIKFVNAGNQSLEPSDFAKAEPPGASISGICFGAQIKSDNPNSVPVLNAVNEHTLDIEFDFLKPKESFTLIVWHDGDVSFRGDLKSGKVREGKGRESNFMLGALFIVVQIYTCTLMFTTMLTFSISIIWGPPIASWHDFIISSYLPFSLLISFAIICIPILIYSLIQSINSIFRSNK